MEAWRTLYNTASSKKLVDNLLAQTPEFTFAELWFTLTMASKKWQLIPRNCNIMSKTWGFQLLNPKLGMLPKLPSYWNLHFTVWNTHTLQTLILRNDRQTFIQLHKTYCRLIRTDSNTFCNKIQIMWSYGTHQYYTPGRGKIVPRNVTPLVGEKLCRVMYIINYTPGRGKIVPRNVM